MRARKNEPLTHEYLTYLLSYDCATGLFTREVTTGTTAIKGMTVGSAHNQGYISVSINRNKYLLHRLAWFYVHKEWPEVIDHINGDKKDNRIANLRSVTQYENTLNRKKYKGFQGVHWCSQQGRYKAKIKIDKKTVYIGSFKCPKEAEKAYLEKKRERNIECGLTA